MSFRGKTSNEAELVVERCIIALEKFRKVHEDINQGITKVRSQTGRIFDRARRLSHTVTDTWNRNNELEMKIQVYKRKDEENAKYKRTVTSLRKELNSARSAWKSAQCEFQSDLDKARLVARQLHNHLEAMAKRLDESSQPNSSADQSSILEKEPISVQNDIIEHSGTSEFLEMHSCNKMNEFMSQLRHWHAHSATSKFELSCSKSYSLLP
jgi:prophage DNA circulation protein